MVLQKKLIFSILFTLFCLSMAHMFMTNFYKVEVKTVKTTTLAGDKVSLRIYKPKKATKENKAPAIVLAHGLSTTKECYTQYAIEFSKRGYVVVTPDMLNHGDSDIVSFEKFFVDVNSEGYGVYSAVRYIANLDYVNTDKIGIMGHSMGGNATNFSIMLDNNNPNPIIDSVFLLSSDATYKNQAGDWENIYKNRSVGLFFTTYDHVYFATLDKNNQPVSNQKFLESDNAKSFVSFGQNPNVFSEKSVISNKDYTNSKNDKAIRRIVEEREIHPYAQGGDKAIKASLDFFKETLNTPFNKEVSFLTGNIYQIFSFLSLIGAIMIGIFVIGNLTNTNMFKSIKSINDGELRPSLDKKGKIIFFSLTTLNCAFAFLSISLIFKFGFGYFVTPRLFPQQVSNIFALWSLINGLFILIVSFISYNLYDKRKGITLKQIGLNIGFKNVLKSIIVAIIGIISILTIVYIAGYILQLDLRVYLWGIRSLPLNNYYLLFTYLPYFLIFSISVSIAINSIFYSKIWNEPKWANDLFFAIVNFIPAFVITFVGYYLFVKTGFQPNIFGSTFTFTYMINAIPVFPFAVYILRKIYRYCNNPYVSGIIVGVLLTFFQVCSVFTCHTFMFMK